MANILERREELLRTAEERHKNLFAVKIRELEAEYENRQRREIIIQAFRDVLRRWNLSGRKAAGVGIGILYSSVLMRTYEYYLAAYGEEFYLDRNPTETMLRPPCFFEMFEEEMSVILDELRRRYPRLCRCEEDAVRYQCVEYYHAAFQKLCETLLKEIMDSPEFRELNRAGDFFFFFGRYQGEGEILYRCGG